jgi:hypothetical protein
MVSLGWRYSLAVGSLLSGRRPNTHLCGASVRRDFRALPVLGHVFGMAASA